MDFEEELNDVLPADFPHRDTLVVKCAAHLRLIVEANAVINLTRITNPREAAIKHVLDSVMPWRVFAQAERVLDAGTGPGFPGIPLAMLLPEIRFTLSESTGKKARFVESVVAALELGNVTVSSARAEEICRTETFTVITGRAIAPISRLVVWLAPALRRGATALLYKGPDVNTEIDAAAADLKKHRVGANVILQYDLPEGLGERAIARLTSV